MNLNKKKSNSLIIIKLLCKKNIIFKHKGIKLYWIPSYIGVEGNNKAKIAAKSALNMDVDPRTKILYTDFKKVINKYIKKECQRGCDDNPHDIIFAIQPRRMSENRSPPTENIERKNYYWPVYALATRE